MSKTENEFKEGLKCQRREQIDAQTLPVLANIHLSSAAASTVALSGARAHRLHSEGPKCCGMMQGRQGGQTNATGQPLPESAAAAELSYFGTRNPDGPPLGDSSLEEEHSSEAGWETASDEAEAKKHAAAADSNGASTARCSTSATEEQSQNRPSKVSSSVVSDHTVYFVTPAL